MNKVDKLKRYAVNAFIGVIIVLFTIAGMPRLVRAHALLQDKIRPLLHYTGLWQAPWDLFAPEPDKTNIRVSAEVHYPDGSVFRWRSKDWHKESRWHRFRYFRQQEYYDNARRDVSQPAWPALARHLVQMAEEQHDSNHSPTHISLTRHWWTIPNPKLKLTRIANINEPMQSYQFYHQAFPGNTNAR